MSQPKPLTTKVKAKTMIAILYFCEPKAFPPIVDVITDGSLATDVKNRKYPNLISVSPIKYVIKSLGVPGRKNRRKTIILTFFLSLRNLSSLNFS